MELKHLVRKSFAILPSVTFLITVDWIQIDLLIDWCLVPTLAVFQLYSGMLI
jgi:hypothetical protein